MSSLAEKQSLKNELIALLQADLDLLERVHHEITAGATHEEAKPENDKDTRALEQTYLARGQAQRVEMLRAALSDVRNLPLRSLGEDAPACLGALITIEEDGRESTLFLAPGGGGMLLAGGRVQVVTTKSPLGGALLGLQAGDDCEVPVGDNVRELYIVRIA